MLTICSSRVHHDALFAGPCCFFAIHKRPFIASCSSYDDRR